MLKSLVSLSKSAKNTSLQRFSGLNFFAKIAINYLQATFINWGIKAQAASDNIPLSASSLSSSILLALVEP